MSSYSFLVTVVGSTATFKADVDRNTCGFGAKAQTALHVVAARSEYVMPREWLVRDEEVEGVMTFYFGAKSLGSKGERERECRRIEKKTVARVSTSPKQIKFVVALLVTRRSSINESKGFV